MILVSLVSSCTPATTQPMETYAAPPPSGGGPPQGMAGVEEEAGAKPKYQVCMYP
jgi:hypothetical protein